MIAGNVQDSSLTNVHSVSKGPTSHTLTFFIMYVMVVIFPSKCQNKKVKRSAWKLSAYIISYDSFVGELCYNPIIP